jgi:IS605 OrfB family transposase
MIAIDLNLDNATTFDTTGMSRVYQLSQLVKVHQTYRRITSRFTRKDDRIRRSIHQKYATIERNKNEAILHTISSEIAAEAVDRQFGVIMEDLRGIRKIFSRASGSSKYYLSKMNSWPFARLQRQIDNKVEWHGLPVFFVPPEGTSSVCSECRGRMLEPPMDFRTLVCRDCGMVIDRDLNAAKNILSRGMRSMHEGYANEAVKGPQVPETGPKAGADADHSSGRNV